MHRNIARLTDNEARIFCRRIKFYNFRTYRVNKIPIFAMYL